MDANGWAVNAKAKLSVPFGAALTGLPKLPPGSKRDVIDPYAEKKSPWPWIIAVALVLYLAYLGLDKFGYIHQWTGGRLGHTMAAENAKTTPDSPAPAPAPDSAK
jgi:hypothetical protein